MPPRRRSQDSLAAALLPQDASVDAAAYAVQQEVAAAAAAAAAQPTALSQEGQQPQPGAPDAADAAAAAAEAERLRQEEAAVLAEAARIRARLQAAKVAPAPEPKRGKTHWDCLLEEMVWLAKEFAKERAWKVKTAKRYAVAAQKSERDLEARVAVRAREEEKALRKRAAWIAKEVAAFWCKAQRVVAFKVRSEVEAKKKEVMDKQLDFLLGQTQKYSTMLAERLKGEEAAKAAAALGTAGSQPLSAAPSFGAPAPSGGELGEEVAPPRPRRSHRAVSPALPASAAVSGTAEGGDDSAEYRSGEDDDADNEATIEEEEAMAAAEGRDVKHEEAAELAGLDEEAELPLEELLARYGNYHLAAADYGGAAGEGLGVDAEDEVMGDSDAASDAGSDLAAVKLEGGEEEGTAALLEGDAPLAPAGEDEGTAALLEQPAAAAAPPGDPGAGPSLEAHAAAGEEADEEEYRGDEDDVDNEATIEEEEAMAAAEGRDVKHEEAAELAGLDEEAELPLEELLARYGNYHLAAAGGDVGVGDGGDEAEASGDEDMPDAQQPKPLPVRVKKEEPAAVPTGVAARAGSKPGAEEETEGEADIKGGDSGERMGNAIAAMAGLQPLGTTLDTADVQTKTPFLIKGVLREYQQIGLDWLVTLYHKRLNGILADEMGLGKTIQTIALLAHLACEKGDWGPHLVVVPTSVMLNWEMEFKKWCPAFKLLTYYGSVKERAAKRQGWSKPNAFHVCITSYTLVLQDARMFKRKKWKYLILDEAHMIKNWKSQRWQTLLNFNSKRRLLITGTPLQNDLMELWSLMHFLMPQVFASHAQFKDWFSNPLTGMVEGSAEMNRAIVERLHAVLRPFLLRRLKKDVEKQLPQKHEHVVYCRLSKRQRQLYEEYMASGSTRATLASGNFLGIMNCLMQLRKVCNHPDLFEGRPIISAYDMQSLELRLPNRVPWLLERAGPFQRVGLDRFLVQPPGMAAWEAQAVHQLALAAAAFAAPQTTPEEDVELLLGAAAGGGVPLIEALGRRPSQAALQAVVASVAALSMRRRRWRAERTAALGAVSCARAERGVALGAELAALLAVRLPARDAHLALRPAGSELRADWEVPAALRDLVKLPERRAAEAEQMLRAFCCFIPKARAPPARLWCSHPDTSLVNAAAARAQALTQAYCQRGALLHTARIRTQLFFPDRRLIQFDCGKLQELAVLLARLKAGGHKCLIFTQMSKMLDVLEVFLNLHAHTYVRLDGATKPEQRQVLTQRFNSDPKIFCFILSTRSGGVGMNLIGADTVIFYDSDWNPAMDAQAQDRCHRIGQTREVHIYRLVSEHTIEENILKKSDQKRQLDFLAIQSGGFTTDILTSLDPQALLGGLEGGGGGMSAADIAAAMRAAEDEGDAAAAAAVEREAAAEMDEFVKEPGPGASEAAEGGDDTTTRDSGAGGAAVAGSAGAAAAATSRERASGGGPAPSGGGGGAAAGAGAGGEADDEEMMRDVAAMAGSAGGAVSLAQLESALAPVERYAVRFIEVEAPQLDRDGLAAKMEAEYRVEEFDIERMEEAEEEREAEIDEDEEANVVVDWDEYNAVEAYRTQVEAAQRAEKEREAAEVEWLKNYYLDLGLDAAAAHSAANGDPAAQALAIPLIAAREAAAAAAAAAATAAALAAAPPAAWSGGGRGGRGRGRGRGGRGSGGAAVATWDAGVDADGPASKRQRLLPPRPFQQPWEPLEDFLLCSALCGQLEAGLPLAPAAYQAAADALAGGGAAAAAGELEAAAARGQKRGMQACRQRYASLLAAAAAVAGQAEGKENVAAAAAALERQMQQQVAGGGGAKAAAIVHAVLERTAGPASCSTPQEAELARQLQRQLAGMVAAARTAGRMRAPLPPAAADGATLPLARQLAAAVQRQVDATAAAGVAARLPLVLDAARAGGAAAAGQAAAAAFASAGGGTLPPPQLQQQPWPAGQQAFPLPSAPEAAPLEALAAFGLAPSLGPPQPASLPLPGFPPT